MAILYSRKETKDKIIIIYRHYSKWYFLMIGSLICLFTFPASVYTTLIAILFGASTIILLIDTWKPNMEIRKAMKKGQVKISGSKLSFDHPLKVVIEKNNSRE